VSTAVAPGSETLDTPTLSDIVALNDIVWFCELVSSDTVESDTVNDDIVGFWSSVFVIDTEIASALVFPAASETVRVSVSELVPNP
jgi:hypothetical protein